MSKIELLFFRRKEQKMSKACRQEYGTLNSKENYFLSIENKQ